MTDRLHNNPPVALELDRELVEFLVENCDSNLRLSLNLLNTCVATPDAKDRKTAKKLVDMIEKFRKIKTVAKRGLSQ